MQTPATVTLFVQCLIDALYPAVADAVLQIFDKLKIPFHCPADQTCCGQPAFNAGYRKEAAAAARHFIQIFEKAECIVCPSGSCVHMVRHHYPMLFQKDPVWRRRAEHVSRNTFELTEFLVDKLGIVDLGARFDGRVTYHDACHPLRGLGIREQPRQLIRAVSGAELIEMTESERCCGFGGSFAVKYPEISAAMVGDKVDNIIASGADAVVGVDISCLMNIQGMLSRRQSAVKIMHIAELLAG